MSGYHKLTDPKQPPPATPCSIVSTSLVLVSTTNTGCVPELLAAVASTVGLRNVGQYWRCPATDRERNAAPAADLSRLLWTVVKRWQTELQRLGLFGEAILIPVSGVQKKNGVATGFRWKHRNRFSGVRTEAPVSRCSPKHRLFAFH